MALPGTDANRELNDPQSNPRPARDRWKTVESIFNAASEMNPLDRPAFLSAVCAGDRALRQEVESLLEAAERTLGLLQRPVREAVRSVADAEPLGRRRIGNYELIKLIGEGGMGEVYLAARADEQFRQYVAIKLMRRGLDAGANMVPRFLAERQILANLDHPNIARLLDGGLTPEGWPYLVMELVDGIPIDEYCRNQRLSTLDRLHLFRIVCAAVEHTHHNLIVHRDIKPANILVNTQGVPKLLDFGIAQLLDADDAPSDPARPALRLMTPEYASPEQILGKPITTATDVFALGVLLYELLSGRNPFRAAGATPPDLPREICEREPPSLIATAKSNPDRAAPDARRWTSELESIVRKAMHKNPAERYQSAGRLSSDIRAYEQGRPVSTRQRDWRYVAMKFAGRHKTSVTFAAVLLVTLIGTSIGMAALARRATVERLKAEREAQFLVGLFKAATPEVARGEVVTARNLLDQGAKRIDTDLASVPPVQASMLTSLAESYESLGLYHEAETMARRSYQMKSALLGQDNADTADTLFLLANLIRLQSRYAEAEALFRKLAAVRRRTLGENSAAYASSLSALGESLYLESKDAEAEPQLRQALAINRRNGPDYGLDCRNYLALVLERKGDYTEAMPLLHEAVEIGRRSGVNTPDYVTSLHNLASAQMYLGDMTSAEMELREVLAIRRRILGNAHPDLLYTLNNLAYLLIEKGDWRAAQPLLREAMSIDAASQYPGFVGILSNWARVLQAQGDRAGAHLYFEKALDRLRANNALTSWPASQILINMSLLEFDSTHYVAAETLARQALEMRRELGGDRTPAFAAAQTALAEAQLFQGYPHEAVDLLRAALEIRQNKLTPAHPDLVAAKVRLGEALIADGDAATAEPILRDAVASASSAPFPLLAWQTAEADSALAACWMALGMVKDAEPLDRKSESGLALDPRPAFRQPVRVRLQEISRTVRRAGPVTTAPRP
jgi:serine/threonine protein kinase